jgi:hypothetical protein
MKQKKNACTILVGRPQGTNHIRSLGVALKMETKLKCLGIMSKDKAMNFQVP